MGKAFRSGGLNSIAVKVKRKSGTGVLTSACSNCNGKIATSA
jgi:hypothetical protein